MHVKIITNTDYYVDNSGKEHEAVERVFDMPFELGQIVYTIESRRNGKKFVVIKHTLCSICCYTNGCFYKTSSGELIYDTNDCFTDKNLAIRTCLELTEKAKIKIVDKSSHIFY